jgi:hypothetical protein
MWRPGPVCEIENLRGALEQASISERLAYLRSCYVDRPVAVDDPVVVATVRALRAQVWNETIHGG